MSQLAQGVLRGNAEMWLHEILTTFATARPSAKDTDRRGTSIACCEENRQSARQRVQGERSSMGAIEKNR